MSDQDVMTREQLEAAGSVFGLVANMPLQRFVEMPDGTIYSRDTIEALCEDATQHYRQQQELARLREFKWKVHHAYHFAKGIDDDDISNAAFFVQVIKSYGDDIFKEPAVDKSEHTE